MSFMNNTRLVFSGTFQADVSTVNNDVRHYSNADWDPRFQTFRDIETGVLNGWWNPVGSGAFRLIGCKVTGVHYKDGTGANDAAKDPAIGLWLGGANERTAAKLVDLDPQWQMASAIWALEIRLTAGKEPAFAHGKAPTFSFRDLMAPRIHSSTGDSGMSSNFQGVLEGVTWSDDAHKSRALKELREQADADSLSIRLMTFGYIMDRTDPHFTLGKVLGVIGPYKSGEPKTVAYGRRFTPQNIGNDPQWSGLSWCGINYFTGAIDDASSTLFLDLGNALQLSSGDGSMSDIGKLSVGVLLDPAAPEKAPVTAQNFQELGEIDYRKANWLYETSGIVAQKLTAAQRKATQGAPLALVAEQPAGTKLIAVRENANGLYCQAEEFVHRIDAPGKSNLTIYAAQYGKPLPGASVSLTAWPPTPGLGGSGKPHEPDPPKASIPDACTPASAFLFPASVTADAGGKAHVTIIGTPPNNPRQYLDGQIYVLQYGLTGESPDAHPQLEVIVTHLRDAYVAPATPSWIPDIAPIFTQFGNLYPIMSRRLIDLSDPDDVMKNLKLLKLAFSLDINDPNYMPVTRDLSDGKRLAIQRWLDRLERQGDPTFVGGLRPPSAPQAHPAAMVAPAPAAAAAAEEDGGKTTFMRGLKNARAAQAKK